MTTNMSVEVVGVRDAIRSLNKLEPGLRRQFAAQVNEIAQPAIQAVQHAYDRVPLSGMERAWVEKGRNRKIFPFTLAKARRGVKVKLDARREATAIILITQTDRGTAVFETAGRKTVNPLGRSLGYVHPGQTRIIGPTVYRKRRAIEAEMKRAALVAVRRVEKELN